MKKEDFKVYSNPDIRDKMKESDDVITIDLEIPDEDTITALFVASPYFEILLRENDPLYYPTDLSADESLLAPLLSEDVFWDFIESSKRIRLKEKLHLGPLFHILVDDDDDDDMDMVSLFDGPIQMEFIKFFKTVVMAVNMDVALEPEFDGAFIELMGQLENNGYLDEVMNNIAVYMDDPELLSLLLFDHDDEE